MVKNITIKLCEPALLTLTSSMLCKAVMSWSWPRSLDRPSSMWIGSFFTSREVSWANRAIFTEPRIVLVPWIICGGRGEKCYEMSHVAKGFRWLTLFITSNEQLQLNWGYYFPHAGFGSVSLSIRLVTSTTFK